MKTDRRAFSLVEILIGIVFLVLALLGMLLVNQSSSRGAMDSQFELLAHCLAQEPIEVFQHLGYSWIAKVVGGTAPGLPAYPVGQMVPITEAPFAEVMHPVDAVQFQRRIDIEPTPLEKDGVKGFRVTVTVAPVGGAAAVWLSRDQVREEALIVEEGI